MPMGIVVFLVLLFLFVVLFVRAKNESTDKKAAIQPESQDDYKSPFDAGPLTLQQKNQDDWDGPGKVLKSDRFWGEKQNASGITTHQKMEGLVGRSYPCSFAQAMVLPHCFRWGISVSHQQP